MLRVFNDHLFVLSLVLHKNGTVDSDKKFMDSIKDSFAVKAVVQKSFYKPEEEENEEHKVSPHKSRRAY